MKKARKMFCLILMTLFMAGIWPSLAPAEEQPDQITLDQVIVTASRYETAIKDVPASVTLITREMIEDSNELKIDGILSKYAGIDVSRSSFLTHSADVVLRGMGEMPGRTLILLDGNPINKADTGSANWDLFRSGDVERIEIIRGPSSVLYGSSGMGGVINIISRKPEEKPVTVDANAGYGTFETVEMGGGLSGKLNGFGYSVSYNQLKSDGYNPVPEDQRDQYDVERYLEEKHLKTTVTYELPNQSSLSFGYLFYDDKHGEGTKIQQDDGVYRKWKTNATNLDYGWSIGSAEWLAKVYYNKEDYFWNRESISNSAYTWYQVDVDRIDNGGSMQSTFPIISSHLITSGVDYKFGSVDGGDYYIVNRDSPSDKVVLNKGKQRTYSLFLNDHYQAGEKVIVDVGLRYDYVKSYDGSFSDSSGSLESRAFPYDTWSHASPKTAALYRLSKKTSIRGSIGTAFRAPILDDLCRNGILRGRIYAANPDLGPETLISYETGIEHKFSDAVSLGVSGYYSNGKDFFYSILVGIDPSTGRDLYQRKNVGGVHIYGAEATADWALNDIFGISVNYTYNISKIDSFSEQPELEGKYLEDTPTHKAGFTLSFNHPSIFRAEITGRYVGERYGDTDNTDEGKLDSYFATDLKLSRAFLKYLETYVNIENVFDKKIMYSSDYEGPGAIYRAGVTVKF
ncbi:MAG: TonB-dependent receptor [Deltaproteobacteria bacterium]|nr:TonB-dependent receptor [Deltaproteobacteria bacterium]